MTTRDQEASPAERKQEPAGTAEQAPLSGTVTAPPDNARQLQLEIERTRDQLGETVQELVARADVKARARAKASEVSGRYKSTWEAMPEQLRRAVTKGTNGARERWVPLTAVAGALILNCLAVWQWRRDQ